MQCTVLLTDVDQLLEFVSNGNVLLSYKIDRGKFLLNRGTNCTFCIEFLDH